MIRLVDITKRFSADAPPAIANLNLDITKGELAVLVGPSGCGKTTTLRMINRLIEPTSGRIELDGVDVTNIDPVVLRRGIGYVIQQDGLFPHHTIKRNIATVPRLLGWDAARINARVTELLELTRLSPDIANRYPAELSGGQRQRVGVARALAADPPVLLMDEPFGAIDPITRGQLQQEFLRLQSEVGKTVVFVTHDLEEAVLLGDRIALFDVGGRIAQFDTPERILGQPADAFVATFVGQTRGLRRLEVLDVRAEYLLDVTQRPSASPDHSTTNTQQIPLAGSSLKDALAATMLDANGWVDVVDAGGTVLGGLTPDAISRAAQEMTVAPRM